MTPRLRPSNRVRELVKEVAYLRGKVVEQEILSTAKDEAMRDYVNHRIGLWNAAIRATNGPRPGESMPAYQKRLADTRKDAAH